MKRVIGLCMFAVGAGMALMLFLPFRLATIFFILILLIGGYNLFCMGK